MNKEKPIVLASGNKGKLKEIQSILMKADLTLRPQSDFDVPEADETGLTFIENALIKARHAAQLTGHPAIADDSGLVVPALDGAPGIYSARYGEGPPYSAENNVHALLTALKDTPSEQRNAYFFCCLVFLSSATDPAPIICQGLWHGRIHPTPQGTHGFGYDPIFWLEEHQKTAAELAPELKNTLSHRAQALQHLRTQL